jgi:magnesium transporter
VWDPVRARLRAPGSQLRRADADFLAYTLIDAMVDHVCSNQFGDRLESLEDEVLQNPGSSTIQEIHGIKRELSSRRAMWPMREVLQRLHREPHECFSEITRTYVRDVYEHAVEVIDIVETYRELAAGLTETHMTPMSNRMNEIVKVRHHLHPLDLPRRRLRHELPSSARAGVAVGRCELLDGLGSDRRGE